MEYLLFRARQTIFESGDKAGKFLARYIKQKKVQIFDISSDDWGWKPGNQI